MNATIEFVTLCATSGGVSMSFFVNQHKSHSASPFPHDSRLILFFVIAGIVASVLIAIILIVIIVLKYIVFKLDPSYKVTEDKSYQQGASAALLGNQVTFCHRPDSFLRRTVVRQFFVVTSEV